MRISSAQLQLHAVAGWGLNYSSLRYTNFSEGDPFGYACFILTIRNGNFHGVTGKVILVDAAL
jgi:hypothetical protein